MATNAKALALPTVSIVVPCSRGLTKVLGVKFRTKHGGRIGIPGEKWDYEREDPKECAQRAAREELGLEVSLAQIYPLTVRAKRDRDTRAPKTVDMAGTPILIEPRHCLDLVYEIEGLDDVDPDTLTPGDTVEVEKIVAIAIDGEIEPLAMSDDVLLLAEYRKHTLQTARPMPRFLHDAW